MLYSIHLSLGEHIRQLRRQHNLTQSELGAERFSKSYVSAVERDKLNPSPEALLFFANQLQQPQQYFQTWQRENDQYQQVSVLSSSTNEALQPQHDVVALLDNLLDNPNLASLSSPKEDLPDLSFQIIESLPMEKRSRYYFLRGLSAQEKLDLDEARTNFEIALAFAHEVQRPAIIDELGLNYYLLKKYHIAIEYHLRARQLLTQLSTDGVDSNLLFRIELHCASDFHALGDYRRAIDHYEWARQHLHAKNDVQTAGKLYWGIGYCSYMAIYLNSHLSSRFQSPPAPEETEQIYQTAMGYLIQSRTLYQVGQDKQGEDYSRLTLSHVLLDLSNFHEHNARQRQKMAGAKSSLNITSLLDEAREQCRQVIMSWQGYYNTTHQPPSTVDLAIYDALAQLIRISTLRAAAGRLNGYTSTASKELLQASDLCQQALESLQSTNLPFSLLQKIIRAQPDDHLPTTLSLPQLQPLQVEYETTPERALGQAELALSAAIVAEEIGNAAQSEDYALLCYQRADQFLKCALDHSQQVTLDVEYTYNYQVKIYQQCISHLENRLQQTEIGQTQTTEFLLQLFQQALFQVQQIVIQAI